MITRFAGPTEGFALPASSTQTVTRGFRAPLAERLSANAINNKVN